MLWVQTYIYFRIMLPDLRTPSPDCTEVNPDTVVLLHWVGAMKIVGDRLSDFEQTADQIKLHAVCSACDDAIAVIEDFKRRCRGIQREMNKTKRKAISAWEAAYFRAKHASNKELAAKLKDEKGWIDTKKYHAIRRGELPYPD